MLLKYLFQWPIYYVHLISNISYLILPYNEDGSKKSTFDWLMTLPALGDAVPLQYLIIPPRSGDKIPGRSEEGTDVTSFMCSAEIAQKYTECVNPSGSNDG